MESQFHCRGVAANSLHGNKEPIFSKTPTTARGAGGDNLAHFKHETGEAAASKQVESLPAYLLSGRFPSTTGKHVLLKPRL